MKALNRESHTNIIRYIADGSIVENASYFIDMELCHINLNEYMKGSRDVKGIYGLPRWNSEKPDVFLITAIMQQLLSGLAFIHKYGKVHRDLDPRNGKHKGLKFSYRLIPSTLFSAGRLVENCRSWIDVRRNNRRE